MHQLVQSAIEAAKHGDKNKAIGFLKQVLNANPNDVDAWLVLAAVMDDPERKRQCLNRVLTLDPVNTMAREELIEMDRAAMGGTPPFTPEPSRSFAPAASVDQSPAKPAPVSKPASQPEKPYYSSGTYSFEPEPDEQKQTVSTPPVARAQTASKSSSKASMEKPQVFKYPLFWRILMYFFVVFFGCVGLLIATQNLVNSLPFLGLGFIMLFTALALSPTVQVSDAGIRASGLFSSGNIRWDEIARIKSNAMKRRLELSKQNGEVVNVSTQVSGYPRIVEIIRQKRPDLFGLAPAVATQTSAFSSPYNNEPAGYATPTPAVPSFKGTRTFRKGFFKQYGLYFLIVPFCMLAVWTGFFEPQYRIGAIVSAFFCIAFMVIPLFQVSVVKVESNKLTFETLFDEKAFNAKQIRDVKMQSVRGRYGRVTNYVNIVTAEGKNYPLQGFSEGDEIIYGILTNWWNTNRGG